jgi:hypothetical protein
MKKPTPSQLLANSLDRLVDCKSVPFKYHMEFVGTQRPLDPENNRGHLSASELVYDFTTDTWSAAVASLVMAFQRLVAARGVKPSEFVPLPHAPAESIGYSPGLINGIPVRLISSYSHMDLAFRISLDAFAPDPSSV